MSNSAARERRSVSLWQRLLAITGRAAALVRIAADNDHPVIPQNLYRMSGGDTKRRALRTDWPILAANTHSWRWKTTPVVLAATPAVAPPAPICARDVPTPIPPVSMRGQTWVRAPGSIRSLAFTHAQTRRRLPTIIVVTRTMAYRTGFIVEADDLNPALNPKARPISLKPNMSPRTNTPGARSIPENATCTTTLPTVSSRLAADQPISHSSAVGSTVRMRPAIVAWADTGATMSQIEPDPGNDGIGLWAYKVTNPTHRSLALRVCTLQPEPRSSYSIV